MGQAVIYIYIFCIHTNPTESMNVLDFHAQRARLQQSSLLKMSFQLKYFLAEVNSNLINLL